MQVGLVGVGKIGRNLALQALRRGYEVVGYDAEIGRAEALEPYGMRVARSLEEMLLALELPRTVLVYVPHGAATESVVARLEHLMKPGDLVADGGNSHFEDSRRRSERARERGIEYLDVGTSGGVIGARHGACFMVGGTVEGFTRLCPLLRNLAVADGVLHVGPAGAGHFVKLVHNAIEFGMLQALGEGLDLLVRSDYSLDLPAIFDNWSHGSVIRGWLVELMADGLRETGLDELSSYVEDTREVKWAIEYALEREAWIPVITQAELALYRYRDADSVAAKGVAILRHGFGGHTLHRQKK